MNYIDLSFYSIMNVYFQNVNTKNGATNFIVTIIMLVLNLMIIIYFIRIIFLH